MKLYRRENYLRKIRGFYHDAEIIKVITGVRRFGKNSSNWACSRRKRRLPLRESQRLRRQRLPDLQTRVRLYPLKRRRRLFLRPSCNDNHEQSGHGRTRVPPFRKNSRRLSEISRNQKRPDSASQRDPPCQRAVLYERKSDVLTRVAAL